MRGVLGTDGLHRGFVVVIRCPRSFQREGKREKKTGVIVLGGEDRFPG